ncbi:MAG: tripartite tricarboxylate transporter substrate binding protein [Nocardioidaceae bacterium]
MRRTQKNSFALTAAASAVLVASACTSPTTAESSGSWTPSGDVTMVVPFEAGGGSDLSGRAMATGLEKVMPDLTATVENRDGGSGAVGYSYFLSKEGDPNYVLATETALLALPLSQDVEFDHKSFTPIMKVGEDYTMMVVDKDSPYQTCPDVVEASKSQRIVAGISGITGTDNIVLSRTEQKMGAKFDRVPYESGSELTAALLGDQLDIASLNPGEVIGQLESGDLKALCVFAPQRYDYPELADIPTAEEEGIDVSFAQYRGLIAPGGISEAERQGWVEAARKFAQSPAYDKYIETNYMQPKTAFGDDFGTYLTKSNDVMAQVLR